jgi:hypothetical protein
MHAGMIWNVVRLLTVLLLVVGWAPAAFAQATPASAASPAKEPTTLLERIKEPDQGGGFHFTKNLAIVFGGIKSGSGIALGPAISAKFEDGSYVQVKGVYSVKKFKLLQARYDSRKFWDDRASLVARARWQDAPKLHLYELGPDAPELRVDWGEKKTEASARLRLQLDPTFRIGTGFGIEKYETTGGRIDLAVAALGLSPVPPPPGLGTKPVYAHAFFSAAHDSRTTPEYSVRGHLFEASIHSYNDVKDGQDPFGRFEAIAQQLIPTGAKGVIDVSAQTWISLADGDRLVPFFLMPTLGGSNYLRAYPSYRFRDRHALLLRGEYRWPVHKMIDVAGLVEAGKVAPEVKGLKLRDMAGSYAAGIRVHSKTSSIVDLDLAHGRDGFKFTIGFNSGGS